MNANGVESALPNVGEHLPKKFCEAHNAGALVRYAQASGDDNPLHLDPSLAQKAGLAERPIHGMLMVGYFEPMIFAWRPDLALIGLSVKFLRPVLIGQSFELSGRVIRVSAEARPNLILRLMAHAQGQEAKPELALVAEAMLVPRSQHVAAS